MESIKRLLLCHVPVTSCNLRCSYCYITKQRKWDTELTHFTHTANEIAYALNKTRMGGPCLINLCGGGETLLPPEMTGIIAALLDEGHYLEVVTNGTISKRINEIVQLPRENLKHLCFKFSFHYLELLRLGLLDSYIENIKKIRNAGCSFTIEMTPYDELEQHIEDIKKFLLDRLGGLCQLTVVRNDLDSRIPIDTQHDTAEYFNIWSGFSSKMFDYKQKIYGVKRKEFCYAGLWSLNIRLGDGTYSKCYSTPVSGNIFTNPDKPLSLKAIGHCPVAYCYNGHAHLTLGLIPEIDDRNYSEMRNIKFLDGTDSLSYEVSNFFKTKLKFSNIEIPRFKQKKIYLLSWLKNLIYKSEMRFKNLIRRYKNKML